jgi:hypothetical protein
MSKKSLLSHFYKSYRYRDKSQRIASIQCSLSISEMKTPFHAVSGIHNNGAKVETCSLYIKSHIVTAGSQFHVPAQRPS